MVKVLRPAGVPWHSSMGPLKPKKHPVSIKIIDGASDVYSLRRKELFWQYKLGTFAPKGLNERAADIELDRFACRTA